ncbi:MAG: hypothetical protein HY827_04250 [Actinobacteria bacterium]|nr:hypothetical protein [Actinomycetota bacterium]
MERTIIRNHDYSLQSFGEEVDLLIAESHQTALKSRMKQRLATEVQFLQHSRAKSDNEICVAGSGGAPAGGDFCHGRQCAAAARRTIPDQYSGCPVSGD